MLNSDYKNEAKNRYEKKVKEVEEVQKNMIKESEILFSRKEKTVLVLKDVIGYINMIKDTPVELKEGVFKVETDVNKYRDEISEFKRKDIDTLSVGGVAMTAIVAGFGPKAAMAIAATFGVETTVMATTTAGLAWLGGGALAAAGSGTAAGTAILGLSGLAGPIGWTIGGIGLLLGGAKMASKNKEIAEKYNKAAVEVEKSLANIKVQYSKVYLFRKGIEEDKNILNTYLKPANLPTTFNYLEMTLKEKQNLGKLVNTAMAVATKLNKKIEVKQG